MSSGDETPLAGGRSEMPDLEKRVTDLVIKLGLLGLFIYWSLTLVAPFALILIWAVILTVALHPLYFWLRFRLGGRGWIAAALLSLLSLGVIIGPAGAMVVHLTEDAHALIKAAESGHPRLPPPPDELRNVPVVGQTLYDNWSQFSAHTGESMKKYRPTLLHIGRVVLGKFANLGLGLLHFAVSVVIMGFLFGPGPGLVIKLRRIAEHVSVEHGLHFIQLSGATIRNVSRGVIGIAVLQAMIAGGVFALFDVPWAGMLGFAVLLLCVVQIGPLVVVIPALIWAWSTMSGLHAAGFTLCLIPLPVIDNVLKPMMMARGLTTPTLVILIGVIGGTLAYGLIGLFLGPIVLAVFYELVSSWADLDRPPDAITPPAK